MTIKEFESKFNELGKNYKTKDLDKFNKSLIKEKIDVSFLKNVVLDKQEYHRTYFQISLGLINDIEGKFIFIEKNFDKLQDWWHTDQLQQFVDKKLNFHFAYKKALKYINHSNPFVRRWAYVMFMPTLVKEQNNFDKFLKLFKDDDEYYVIMAEAWLISYLGIYNPNKTLEYLKSKPLKYNIVGKAIQKICDSHRIDDNYKYKFKEIRKLYK